MTFDDKVRSLVRSRQRELLRRGFGSREQKENLRKWVNFEPLTPEDRTPIKVLSTSLGQVFGLRPYGMK